MNQPIISLSFMKNCQTVCVAFHCPLALLFTFVLLIFAWGSLMVPTKIYHLMHFMHQMHKGFIRCFKLFLLWELNISKGYSWHCLLRDGGYIDVVALKNPSSLTIGCAGWAWWELQSNIVWKFLLLFLSLTFHLGRGHTS